MSYIRLIMNATMKNTFRWKSAATIIFSVAFICIVGVIAFFIIQFINPQVKLEEPNMTVLGNILGLTLFVTSYFSIGIYSSVFAAQSLMREKQRGDLQAMLATPISPDDIWKGKTLGVFIPSIIFCLPVTLLVFLIMNFVFIMPGAGFVINFWMIATSFIAIPLFFLVLVLLVNVVGLTGKASTGNIIGQIPLSVIPALMINLSVRDVVMADSWLFFVVMLGVAVIALIPVLLLKKKLVTETVILSR